MAIWYTKKKHDLKRKWKVGKKWVEKILLKLLNVVVSKSLGKKLSEDFPYKNSATEFISLQSEYTCLQATLL